MEETRSQLNKILYYQAVYYRFFSIKCLHYETRRTSKLRLLNQRSNSDNLFTLTNCQKSGNEGYGVILGLHIYKQWCVDTLRLPLIDINFKGIEYINVS